MAVISDATFTWSDPVTLNTDEVWQSRGDVIFVTTTSAPVENDGLCLRENEALRMSAGSVVRYRKSGNEPVEIAREAV